MGMRTWLDDGLRARAVQGSGDPGRGWNQEKAHDVLVLCRQRAGWLMIWGCEQWRGRGTQQKGPGVFILVTVRDA